MKKLLLLFVFSGTVTIVSYAQDKSKAAPAAAADTAKPKKPAGISDKVKSSRKIDGLFTIYQDTATGSVQLYVKKSQLGKEYIYQSFSINGPTALFLHQGMHRATFVFKVEKSFDKLEFSQLNTNFWYNKNDAVSKTANVDKPEAIFHAEKVSGEDGEGYLINADGLFISEKMDAVKPNFGPSPFAAMQFNLGSLNPAKSKYATIRSFPNNTDIVVDMAYDNPYTIASGGADITDARYVRVRIQHTLIEMPQNDYKPRYDDPRVGYFTETVTDLTSTSPTPYKDLIHRWNLKKKDANAAISEPVKPLVYWIENTTPVEYRDAIMEAGHKWNEAFEKAGYKNAVQMKIMPDDATWSPDDIRYNVIRWVASAQPPYGAIGPSFVNPRTGEILGADITVEWASGSGTPRQDELFNGASGMQNNLIHTFGQHNEPEMHIPGIKREHLATCALAQELKSQFIAASTMLDVNNAPAAELKVMHKQFLTYLIMHEMGHTLGLNHNMKASQMLSPEEINNTAITHKIGTMGSVMDYPAVNIAADKSKQGDYYTTKAGPYDVWAIEFGYTEFAPEQEEAGLNKILSRSTDPQLTFGNDGDDMRSPGKAMDPRVNIMDHTNDAVAYAEDRFKIVNATIPKLISKYTKNGQSYAELRARYGNLQNQRMNMIAAVSRYIGGVYVDRSFPEQKSANKPFTPVPLATQKKAMDVLSKYVFAPNAYDADAQVFPYLQPQRRGFNQNQSGDDPRTTMTVLQLQAGGALSHMLHPATLQRITNTRLYGNQYSVADVMSDLQKGIFNADNGTNVNVYRQNLQSLFVRGLAAITESKDFDDISKAAAFNTLKKIKAQLATAVSTNEETKAHRGALVLVINKALDPK